MELNHHVLVLTAQNAIAAPCAGIWPTRVATWRIRPRTNASAGATKAWAPCRPSHALGPWKWAWLGYKILIKAGPRTFSVTCLSAQLESRERDKRQRTASSLHCRADNNAHDWSNNVEPVLLVSTCSCVATCRECDGTANNRSRCTSSGRWAVQVVRLVSSMPMDRHEMQQTLRTLSHLFTWDD